MVAWPAHSAADPGPPCPVPERERSVPTQRRKSVESSTQSGHSTVSPGILNGLDSSSCYNTESLRSRLARSVHLRSGEVELVLHPGDRPSNSSQAREHASRSTSARLHARHALHLTYRLRPRWWHFNGTTDLWPCSWQMRFRSANPAAARSGRIFQLAARRRPFPIHLPSRARAISSEALDFLRRRVVA